VCRGILLGVPLSPEILYRACKNSTLRIILALLDISTRGKLFHPDLSPKFVANYFSTFFSTKMKTSEILHFASWTDKTYFVNNICLKLTASQALQKQIFFRSNLKKREKKSLYNKNQSLVSLITRVQVELPCC